MSSVDYGQCRSLPNFQSRYMFDLSFTRRPAGVLIPNDMGIRCLGTNIPTRIANEADEIYVHGHRISQPGLEDSSGQLTLTLFETEDMATAQMIATWRNLNRDNDSGIQAPRTALTADLRLRLLNRGKQTNYSYDIRDAFIVDEDKGALDATQRNGIMGDISVTLQYDHFVEGPA